jgi:isoquinoline 1-oxidoreductase subunit alpha
MIKLKVNGAARQFDGDPEMPLLWFLRDEPNLVAAWGCAERVLFTSMADPHAPV